MASNVDSGANGPGTPTAEYTCNVARQVLHGIVSVIVTLVGLGTMMSGISAGLSGAGDVLLFLGLGVVYVLPGGLWFISTLRKRGLRVLVLPDGLSYTRHGRTEIVRWDEVADVWQAISKIQYTFTVRSCKVRLEDGRKYTFNSALRNVAGLIATIQQEVTPRILARASDAYDAGETIPFGKLGVSKAGISRGKRTLPWDQVKRVTVDKGVITVRKQGGLLKWTSVHVAETPNFFVFASLVGSKASDSSDLALLAMSVLTARG
jgi:hypothetical protein